MTSMESKFLDFVHMENKARTIVVGVLSKRGGDLLGKIKWHGPWRKYCFFPETSMLFDCECLADIASACHNLTRDHINHD